MLDSPAQIFANLLHLLSSPRSAAPSQKNTYTVRLSLAAASVRVQVRCSVAVHIHYCALCLCLSLVARDRATYRVALVLTCMCREGDAHVCGTRRRAQVEDQKFAQSRLQARGCVLRVIEKAARTLHNGMFTLVDVALVCRSGRFLIVRPFGFSSSSLEHTLRLLCVSKFE